MNTATFESKLLPDGHLYCPKEFSHKKNALFKVLVIFEDNEMKASDQDIELSAINDHSDDFLSEEELGYYFNLEELSVIPISSQIANTAELDILIKADSQNRLMKDSLLWVTD